MPAVSLRPTFIILSGVLFLGFLSDQTVHASLVFVRNPATVTDSQHFGGFESTKLFDATITEANIGQNSNTFDGGAFASNVQRADPIVYMDFGSSVTADSIVYAQRQGATVDKAGSLNFWFESSLPANGSIPARSPDETLAMQDTGSSLATLPFREYDFTAAHSSQFVVMQVNHFGNGRPGGNELRFGIGVLAPVPEPSTLCLAVLGSAGIGLTALRRRRLKAQSR